MRRSSLNSRPTPTSTYSSSCASVRSSKPIWIRCCARQSVHRLVVCGTQYPNCIRATAFDGLSLNYEVVVASDATSAASEEVAQANIRDLRGVGIGCIPVAELVVNTRTTRRVVPRPIPRARARRSPRLRRRLLRRRPHRLHRQPKCSQRSSSRTRCLRRVPARP